MIEELKIVMEMLSQMTSYAFAGFIIYLVYSIIQYAIIPIAVIFVVKITKDAYLRSINSEPFKLTKMGNMHICQEDSKEIEAAIEFYIKKSKLKYLALGQLPEKIKGLVDD